MLPNKNDKKTSISLSESQRNIYPVGRVAEGNGEYVMEKIGLLIVNFCADAGISDTGDENTKGRIVGYVMKYFSSLSLDDIQRAFEMSIVRDLEMSDDSYTHWGKLTPEYVARILRAYNRIRPELLRRGRAKSAFKGLPAPSIDPKKAESDFRETLIEIYSIFLETEEMKHDFMYHNAYDYLKKRGLVELTPEEKQGILDLCRRRLAQQGTKRKESEDARHGESPVSEIFQRITKKMEDFESLEDPELLSMTKKEAYSAMMKKWRDQNKDPELIIPPVE